MHKAEVERLRTRTKQMFNRLNIVLTPEETERIEIADFGLGIPESVGLQLFTYINTERVCAKELIMFPRQTCPEHRHPSIGSEPGKEETFRCRWGDVYLYVPGERSEKIGAVIPEDQAPYLTVWREVHLMPGEQYTIPPDTLHWFQSGDDGAVVSEFSTTSRDEFDHFTDSRIIRAPKVEG